MVIKCCVARDIQMEYRTVTLTILTVSQLDGSVPECMMSAPQPQML